MQYPHRKELLESLLQAKSPTFDTSGSRAICNTQLVAIIVELLL